MNQNTPIFCLSYFTAYDGQLENLIEALSALIKPTNQEPGCLLYELAQDVHRPNFLIMVEKLTSKEALADHESQTYVKNFVENEMNVLCQEVIMSNPYQARPLWLYSYALCTVL